MPPENNPNPERQVPYLTLVIVNDTEKDPALLRYCLRSLWLLNHEALGTMQILILNQEREDTHVQEIIATETKRGLVVEVASSTCEYVGDRPMWDLLASLAKCRVQMKGRYFLISHKEFLFGPSCLSASMKWLQQHREPYLALGNLLRLGSKEGITWLNSSDRQSSERIRQAMDEENAEIIRACLENQPVLSWSRQKPGGLSRSQKWSEDLFFARLDWLDCLQFFSHSDRLLFQDIYDLVGATWRLLKEAKLAPAVPRIPLEANRVYHLWHAKNYLHFADEAITWFASDPQRWADTRFSNPGELKAIQNRVAGRGKQGAGIYRFRTGPGGTVERYVSAFRSWLARGGAEEINSFYHNPDHSRHNP